MTGRLEEPALLRADGVAAALLGAAPAWVLDLAEGCVVLASAAGIGFLGAADLAALRTRRFDMASPHMAAFARLGRALPRDGRSRLSLLRFQVGAAGTSLPCRCRLLAEVDRDVVLVEALAGAPAGASLADRFAAAFGGLKTPVALRRPDSAALANAAVGSTSFSAAALAITLADGEAELFVGDVAAPAGAAAPAMEIPATPATSSPGTPSPGRIAFVTDADGLVTEIGAGLAALVGPRAADVVGKPLAGAGDGDGRLARALMTRDTWSNVEVDWPTDRGSTVRLRLAALPRFGEGRAFAGFRGFADVVAIAAAAAEPATEAAPETEPPAAAGETRPAPARPTLVAAPEPAPEQPAPERPAARAEAPRAEGSRAEGSRVVRLHPAAPAATEEQPGALPDALNDRERTAFKAIAEALGARWAGQPEAAPPAPEPPAGTRQHAPASHAGAHAAAAHAAAHAAPPARKAASPHLVFEVLDRVPLGLAVIRDNKVLAANRAFLELFGYSDLDDLEIAGGLGVLLEGRAGEETAAVAARRRDGDTFHVEARLGRTPWIDGPAMLMSVREAVPPPPETEAGPTAAGPTAAAPTAADCRAILDSALDGALLIEPGGTLAWASEGAARLLATAADALAGRPLADLLAADDRERVAGLVRSLAAGGPAPVLTAPQEVALLSAGRTLPVELCLSQVGASGRVAAVLRDLSGWKTAEADLVEARKRAEAASDQKSDFLAKMSHEIRTPLNGIIGFSEVILEERFGPIGNDRYRDYIKDIRESGGHLLSLVNDLLDLSKVEAGRMELSFTGVRLNDLVEQAVAVMQPQSSRARVVIRSSLRRGLPAVVADARSVRQVLLNILSNAIKFTKPGGQVIVSTALGETGEVFLRVRDTGVGMSESDVATAMEPFRQLATAPSTGERGTGLGLPLAKALTEANRATFTLTSREGEGTLVEIAFPRQRVLAE